MLEAILLSIGLAASSPAPDARAKDERQYAEGPFTEIDEIHVDYGHFEEYIAWLNSTRKPTMEALKKAGLILDYKVFQRTPKSPDQPSRVLESDPEIDVGLKQPDGRRHPCKVAEFKLRKESVR